eukprot:6213688-Pleurochrysis_carterae.AAC.2
MAVRPTLPKARPQRRWSMVRAHTRALAGSRFRLRLGLGRDVAAAFGQRLLLLRLSLKHRLVTAARKALDPVLRTLLRSHGRAKHGQERAAAALTA